MSGAIQRLEGKEAGVEAVQVADGGAWGWLVAGRRGTAPATSHTCSKLLAKYSRVPATQTPSLKTTRRRSLAKVPPEG